MRGCSSAVMLALVALLLASPSQQQAISGGAVPTPTGAAPGGAAFRNDSSSTSDMDSAAADLRRLCDAMHFMSACSVAKACNASGAGWPGGDPSGPGAAQVSANNPDICQPVQHLATACKLDTGMGGMSGCDRYRRECGPGGSGGSQPLCQAPGLTVLPTTNTTNRQVRSICEEMSMDGCEQCMPSWQAGRAWADCNLLDVYSYLCYQMPEMWQCSDWHDMCAADSSLAFCYGTDGSGGGSHSGGGGGGSGSDAGSGGGSSAEGGGGGRALPDRPPIMKMYFFNEMPFYLLFREWTPRSRADLAGAWLAIFFLGVLYEALQAAYGRFETRFWSRRAARASPAACGSRDVESGYPVCEGVGQQQQEATAAANGGDGGCGCSLPEPQHVKQVRPLPMPAAGSCCINGGAAGGAGSAAATQRAAVRRSTTGGSLGTRLLGGSKGGGGGKGARPGARSCLAAYLEPQLVGMDLARGAARFVLAGLAYLLMLAAMSFNVAIFFAVIAGVAAGSMLFGRWRWTSGVAEAYSHCGCGSAC